MIDILKFLILVIILNLVRYLIGGIYEYFLIMENMHAVMPRFPNCFDVDFSGTDFGLSFIYNFMLWLAATWVFYIAHPALKGNYIIKSLKIYALMCLFFISLAAVYMNHYVDEIKVFYLYSMLDAIGLFAIVGVANGLIFPRMFKDKVVSNNAI